MRIRTSKHTATKAVAREKKKLKIRKRVMGSTERPRLCIFRSTKHVYAQVIDDSTGQTLVSASTLDTDGVKGANKDACSAIGKEVAKRAVGKNIKQVVFDRNGYLYHGRVKALADAAREGGLEF
ncbi:MAG: 50S ribosomal protein L18 [Deltaproteobacteria bacterium]|nr:50S ribosomal protein L18 [Deltaproteobacteria bacterium]